MSVDWEAVAAFKQSPAYLELAVLGRERLLYAEFPALEERERALTARHVERAIWGVDPPATPNPDTEEK